MHWQRAWGEISTVDQFAEEGIVQTGGIVAGRSGVSTLGHAAGVARVFHMMWRRCCWCSGLPPEPFEVSPQDINSTKPESST